jgi:hypothetical protein
MTWTLPCGRSNLMIPIPARYSGIAIKEYYLFKIIRKPD